MAEKLSLYSHEKKNKENKQNLVEVVLFFINYFFSPLNNS